MNSFNEFASSSCCVAPSSNLTVEDKKNLIIKNYLPNLSSYQKINKNLNKQDIRICPDVNFEKNKKNYFLFYNDNLVKLKDYYKEKINEIINSNSYSINLYKDNLLAAMESDKFINLSDFEGIKNKSLADRLFSKLFLSNEVFKECQILLNNLSLINYIIKRYGNTINNEKYAFITV